MTITATIEFVPSPAGIAEAMADLDRLSAEFGITEESDDPVASTLPAPTGSAVSAVFNSTGEGSRTRELLRLLPDNANEALSPVEIGELLTPNDDGSALSAAQVRAVMRNEKRIEHTLRKRGVIAESRKVVCADWTRYDQEGFGRYYVSAKDRNEIDGLS